MPNCRETIVGLNGNGEPAGFLSMLEHVTYITTTCALCKQLQLDACLSNLLAVTSTALNRDKSTRDY